MAQGGAKKRIIENERQLRTFRRLILLSNIISLSIWLVFVFIFNRKIGVWNGIGLFLIEAIFFISYRLIKDVAKPCFAPDGTLIDGGADLGAKGFCEYIYDVFYITIFTQISTSLHWAFWFVFLIVPIFALWKLWKHILQPYFFPQEEKETKEMKKKRIKQEKKANRVKYKMSRR